MFSVSLESLLHIRLRPCAKRSILHLQFSAHLATVIFCYPEVAGLSLEEVEEIFKHGFGIKKSQAIRRAHKVAKENYLQSA